MDLVLDLAGSVTLSMTGGTWIMTRAASGRGETVGGTYVARGDQLELVRHDGTTERMTARVSEDTLTLSSDESLWDFGNGKEPAVFIAVLVRL